MRQKYITIILLVALSIISYWNIDQEKKDLNLSTSTLFNIETLARYEGSGDCETINGGGCWNGYWYPYYREKNQ